MIKAPTSQETETSSEAICPLPTTVRAQKRRGIGWVAGSFLFCPCHLPVTLGLLAFLLGGTAFGALLRSYGLVAGVIITLVWALGTWRGVSLLRSAQQCTTCQATQAQA